MRKQVLSAALLLSLGAPGAFAADWYTGSPANSRPAGPYNPFAALDLSFSAASEQMSGVMVGTIAPFGGLETNGFRLRMIGLLGGYKYDASAPGVGVVGGNQAGGSLLAGYEWIVDRTKIGVYGGLDVMNNRLDKFDPNNDTEGATFGFRAGVDFYSRPTDSTMAAGTFSFTTANMGYYVRLRGGLAVYEQMYLGPEMLALGDSFYTQWRLGLQLSNIQLGPVQFGVSGGYANDSSRGNGAYGILDSRLTF
ncbi:MAG: cellulose biosynthesis protein BcsS [Beijerinckiaceae bacterium]